jgi:hypothetical protein
MKSASCKNSSLSFPFYRLKSQNGVRCGQVKLQVKFFFSFFFTSFDRLSLAEHEKLLFSLSKYFFRVEKYEKLGGTRFFQKTQLFRNEQNFPLSSSCKLVRIFFTDSASKTESRSVVNSSLTRKIF